MDIEIAKLFRKKNKDILKKSLTLEIERNIDTLKKTTDNAVVLEMNKIFIFLKEFFEETNISYDEDSIRNLIDKEKEVLNEIINNEVQNKKEKLEKYFNKELDEDSNIEEEYINSYREHIDSITEKTIESIDLKVRKEICINFTPSILKNYTFKSEDEKERIKGRIDGIFIETIIRRIKDEVKFRDESLKNLCNESYNKYLDLNQRTT